MNFSSAFGLLNCLHSFQLLLEYWTAFGFLNCFCNSLLLLSFLTASGLLNCFQTWTLTDHWPNLATLPLFMFSSFITPPRQECGGHHNFSNFSPSRSSRGNFIHYLINLLGRAPRLNGSSGQDKCVCEQATLRLINSDNSKTVAGTGPEARHTIKTIIQSIKCGQFIAGPVFLFFWDSSRPVDLGLWPRSMFCGWRHRFVTGSGRPRRGRMCVDARSSLFLLVVSVKLLRKWRRKLIARFRGWA